MSNYATVQDVIDRIGEELATELTAVAPAPFDKTKIQADLDAGEGVIDSFLAERYATPVDTVAFPKTKPVLNGYSVDAAVYRLHLRSGVVPDDISDAYKAVLDWLKLVEQGKASLPADSPPTATTAESPIVLESQALVAGRSNMGGL